MDIKINTERRLYVIPCGNGYTCFGFDNCYREAAAMAQMMNEGRKADQPVIVAPTEDMKGTSECYNRYLEIAALFAKHPAANKTWFTPGTPPKVRSILEAARKDRNSEGERGTVLRFMFGDPVTGNDWCNEYDVVGFVGRSTGSQKIPLLIEPLWSDFGSLGSSDGGGAIMTDRVLRIINVNTGRELYRAPAYHLPEFTMEIDPAHAEYSCRVMNKGVNVANFANAEEAGEYIAFMQGYRISRPFRKRSEYLAELAEQADVE